MCAVLTPRKDCVSASCYGRSAILFSLKKSDITPKSEKTKTFSKYSVYVAITSCFLKTIFDDCFLYSLIETALTGGGQANSTESHKSRD